MRDAALSEKQRRRAPAVGSPRLRARNRLKIRWFMSLKRTRILGPLGGPCFGPANRKLAFGRTIFRPRLLGHFWSPFRCLGEEVCDFSHLAGNKPTAHKGGLGASQVGECVALLAGSAAVLACMVHVRERPLLLLSQVRHGSAGLERSRGRYCKLSGLMLYLVCEFGCMNYTFGGLVRQFVLGWLFGWLVGWLGWSCRVCLVRSAGWLIGGLVGMGGLGGLVGLLSLSAGWQVSLLSGLLVELLVVIGVSLSVRSCFRKVGAHRPKRLRAYFLVVEASADFSCGVVDRAPSDLVPLRAAQTEANT